jgi:sugar phosphate isomerase/epimerase
MSMTRREAIAMLSSVTIGSTFVNDSSAEPADELTGCTLGFSTYGLPKHSLEEAIDAVRRARYDSIEICVTADRDAAAENMSYKRRRNVRSSLSQLRLSLSSLMSNLRPMDSPLRHKTDLERLKHDCELAHDLSPDSPPVIQTVLGGKDWDGSKDLCVERLADWVDVAKRHETVIAVKPHRGHAMSRPSEAAWAISQLGSPPQLKMWFDYSHFIFRDLPMERMIAESLPITAGVAVKDAVQVDGKVKFELPGKAGTIDYQNLCKLFYAGGYRGDICVEVSSQVWKQADYSEFGALTDSYRELSTAMRRAGVPRRRL